MGDYNQYLWVESNAEFIKGPVLEVGSKKYEASTFMDYRNLCKSLDVEYLGTDLSDGENVDLTVDFTDDFEIVEKKLNSEKFGTIICMSVLEHVIDIRSFSKNLKNLLREKGRLFVSSPFCWEFHGYPYDYWRFTPESLKELFKGIEFDINKCTISSNVRFDIEKLPKDINDFCYKEYPFRFFHSKLGLLRRLECAIKIILNKKLSPHVIVKNIENHKIIKPCNINLLGVKDTYKNTHN